ncbi:MAG: sulfotransferase domain-containing protein [Deltaproteobacteria bacterium]|nr:MAG: sulfotransferase domain-containing protein [Deltaproteobacteria bacterium]
MTELIRPSRVYQNHHLDSTRWERYVPRDGDVVISTSYKAGTTWTQTIVANLVFQDGELPGGVTEISPWLDMRVRPADEMFARIEAQTHRRFLKTHLALDGIPIHEKVQYIVVGRDARDVFMSLWNHYSHHTREALAMLNGTPGRVGDPLPPCDGDIRALWHNWITRGWFEWEHDGWPYWSHLHHAQSWWEWRHLPNILFVHYNDLLADLAGEMRRIAAWLAIHVPDASWPRIVDAATFDTMKRNAERIVPEADMLWKGGARTFINKGTNGRWRDVLTADDLALYPKAVARSLSPDCARWLEAGRTAQRPD